jgi:lipopolysaccharide transport system permease protein/teichoic acid transport system permease protein
LGALWRRRRTLLALARHDARRTYAGTIAGVAWALLTPLVPFAVLAVVFSVGLRLPLGGAPYVYGFAAAYVPWVLLAGAVAGAAGSLVEHRYLVKRVPFPVALLPAAPVLTHSLTHLVLLALTAIGCAAGGYAGAALLTIPYFYACAVALCLGVGLCLAALAVVVRDVSRGLPALLQVWFWVTPVAWTTDLLPAAGSRLLDLNPAAYVVAGYRHALMPQVFAAPSLTQAAAFWLACLAILAIGAHMFERLRPHFWECL